MLDLNDLDSVAAGFRMTDLNTEENMRYVELVKKLPQGIHGI